MTNYMYLMSCFNFFGNHKLFLLFQIRKSDGTEADVPGVILVIPPPDRKAVHENQKYVSLLQ